MAGLEFVLLLLCACVFTNTIGAWNGGGPGGARKALEKLRHKVKEPRPMPLLEFGPEAEKILQATADSDEQVQLEAEVEQLLQIHLSAVQQHFLERLRTKLELEEDAESAKSLIIRECEAAMRHAIPGSKKDLWSYQGTLGELQMDADDLVEELNGKLQDAAMQLEDEQVAPLSRKAIWRRRLRRWGLQALAFTLNYISSVQQQKAARRAADLRNAELPPFPLL